MSSCMNRREVLARGIRGAALVVGAGASRLVGAGPKGIRQLPDRSHLSRSLPVAIQRCESYEPAVLRRRLDAALDLIGGIGKLVRGKTVAVKLNLTGSTKPYRAMPAYRTYHVHPKLVAALCAALDHAGAKRIVLIESLPFRKPFEAAFQAAGWDIKAIKAAGGHKVAFVDTRNRGKAKTYSRLKVAWGGYLYPAFDVHQAYEKTDVFISLAKMKDHGNAGVTLGVKNLFGMPPTSLYGNDAPNEDPASYRSRVFHHGSKSPPAGVPQEIDPKLPRDWRYRVPRITADVLGARPVDLTVIDGIETMRGGEGPWIGGVAPIQPKLLLVGRNAVCTDAVCTAVMGHDPRAKDFKPPFPGENHLRLLNHVGEGVIDSAKIDVRGLSLRDALCPFKAKG